MTVILCSARNLSTGKAEGAGAGDPMNVQIVFQNATKWPKMTLPTCQQLHRQWFSWL